MLLYYSPHLQLSVDNCLHSVVTQVPRKTIHSLLTTFTHMHDPSRNTWKLVSNLKTPQFKSLVAALPGNELMVVGGITDTGFNTDAVEMASVVQHATSVL